jgi:hypothetical protein
MPLTFDVERIDAYDEDYHGTNREPSVITSVMIFGTMNTGIHRIAPGKVPEFYARMRVIEKFIGPQAHKGDGSPWLITLDDVQRHVGLGTNASTMNVTTFISRVAKQARVPEPEVRRVMKAAREHGERVVRAGVTG